MRCDECLPMLEQYVEGESDQEAAESLTAHMATCRACASAHETLTREQEIYANYLVDVEPQDALWARLQSQLEKEKAISTSQPLRLQRWFANAFGGLHFRPRLATALVLIAIGLTIGVMVWRRTIDTPRQQAQNPEVVGVQPSSEVNRAATHHDSDNAGGRSSANDNHGQTQVSSTESGDRGSRTHVRADNRLGRRGIGRSPATSTVDQVARRAEQQYLAAIKILLRDIDIRRAAISPALLSQLETALAEVDRNIAATRRIAREQPRDPVAVQYLAVAYEKKVELLREVTSW